MTIRRPKFNTGNYVKISPRISIATICGYFIDCGDACDKCNPAKALKKASGRILGYGMDTEDSDGFRYEVDFGVEGADQWWAEHQLTLDKKHLALKAAGTEHLSYYETITGALDECKIPES